jgi:hypothetical protein
MSKTFPKKSTKVSVSVFPRLFAQLVYLFASFVVTAITEGAADLFIEKRDHVICLVPGGWVGEPVLRFERSVTDSERRA